MVGVLGIKTILYLQSHLSLALINTMAEEASLGDAKPEVDLIDMVASLQQVHLNQQAALTALNSEISDLQLQLESADSTLKATLSEQSLLSEEKIMLGKEIQNLESDIKDKLIRELDSLVVTKNSRITKLESLKSKQEKLRLIYQSKEESINAYINSIKTHSLKILSEDDMQILKDKLADSKGLVESLKNEIDSIEFDTSQSSADLKLLEKESQELNEEADKLRLELVERRQSMDKSFEDQVKVLNGKINQLSSVHSTRKSQLRDLNRMISSQSMM